MTESSVDGDILFKTVPLLIPKKLSRRVQKMKTKRCLFAPVQSCFMPHLI